MKKIIVIVLIILLIALGLFFFLGNGKEKITDFFSDGTDFGSFFDIEPQSQNDFVETPSVTPDNNVPTPTDNKFVPPILRQISYEPVSGATSYSTTSTSTITTIAQDGTVEVQSFTSTTTAIRFQERVTGHLYDVFEFLPAPQKVSNTTIQKVYSTIFSNNADQFLHQTLTNNNEMIRTIFNILAKKDTGETILAQIDLSSVITDFTYNKFSNKLIYSVKQNGVSNIYSANFDKTAEKAITALSFNEFLIDPINSTEVLITTKASQAIPGYAYTLNTATGALTKIVGNIPGLLAKVSTDKKWYVYSESEQARPVVRTYNSITGATNVLGINTLPEKCVFAQTNVDELYCFGALVYVPAQYPDDWYKGKVLNSEALYKIDLANNYVQQIYNFEANELTFDAINPQLTSGDGFIIFGNKYNLTLWSLDLNRIKNEVF